MQQTAQSQRVRVVKANSQSNGKRQILTPWGSETSERILMKLGIRNYVAGMPTHANPCRAATAWVVWANTWPVTCWFLTIPFCLFFGSRPHRWMDVNYQCVIRRRILRLGYYRNYWTDSNEILHNDKDYQRLPNALRGWSTRKTNPRWRTATIWKTVKSQYLSNMLTDRLEIWHDDDIDTMHFTLPFIHYG